MSTRSLIAKQVGNDEYLTIYCHHNGDVIHNGAVLLECYNTAEKVDELLALGDISSLGKNINGLPNKKYSHLYEKEMDDMTIAYARDKGEKLSPPTIHTTAELLATDYAHCVYIFTPENEWKYFDESHSGILRDVREDLSQIRDEQNCADTVCTISL